MKTFAQVDVESRQGLYPVLVGAGLAGELPKLLDERRLPAQRFVVSTARIWRIHDRALGRLPARRSPILLPDGERYKTLASVSRIYDALVRSGADRASTVIAFGGGVIGDLAGFAAATYLRGVDLVQVPTTLLGQVDSAVGGKVGVNLAQGKNLVGAFYPPALVVTDPLLLATLPRREFRSGLYEIVKYGVIASPDLFERVSVSLQNLFARDPDALHPIIVESCRIKADVVGRDERESGPRRVLNLGHTVGHALETLTRYRRFLHGEAVALGMLVAAALAVNRHALDPAERHRLAQTIAQMGPLPTLGDLSATDALAAIRLDKKVAAGRLHFVMPTAIGAVEIVDDVGERELARAMCEAGMRR